MVGLARLGSVLLASSLCVAVGPSLAQDVVAKDPQGHPVSILATAFEARSESEDTPFTRYDGRLFGLQQDNKFGPRDFSPPFFNGGGIASGDIDRDGWPDVVSANGALIHIYLNQNGQTFSPIEMDISGADDLAIFNVALVDIDGDGWLDLFGTTYLQGNFIVLNQQGKFTSEGLQQLPRGKAVVTLSAAFGDVDRDGDLDIVLGNWFAGGVKKHPPPHSQNELLLNERGSFEAQPLVELVGETLSTLLSDWSGDGWLDLIVGNDFEVPDFYYRGDGNGGFELIERRDGIIPHTTRTTMSIDTGDYDNDLDLDIFIDQITARATGPSAQVRMLSLEHYCDEVIDDVERDRCRANMATREGFFYGSNHQPTDIRNCGSVPEEVDKRACIGMQVMITAVLGKDQELCERIPKRERRTYSLCRNFFEDILPHDPEMLDQAIPQRMNENVLLRWDEKEQRFVDEVESAGVGFTGWSWNARFADVDNDEWQDLFVVAGSWFRATPSGTTANFFYHNEAGETFSDQTDAYGLQNFMIVSAYTTLDFDRDGDLDFVTNSINGPLWLLRNNNQDGNSVAFQLRDDVGNRDGIGTKFFIHYGPEGERHQMRELKASGGYLSFDEPLAHFGLGEYESVTRLVIEWSTGGTTEIPGPFADGHIYSIQRRKGGKL
jgi:hypothetical protein